MDLRTYIENYKKDVEKDTQQKLMQVLPWIQAIHQVEEEKYLQKLALENQKKSLQIQTDHQIESMPRIQAAQDQTTLDSYGRMKGHYDTVANDTARRNVTAQMHGDNTEGYQEHLDNMAKNQGTRQANQRVSELNTLVKSGYYDTQNQLESNRMISNWKTGQKIKELELPAEEQKMRENYMVNLEMTNSVIPIERNGNYLYLYKGETHSQKGDWGDDYREKRTIMDRFETLYPAAAAEFFFDNYEKLTEHVKDIRVDDEKYYDTSRKTKFTKKDVELKTKNDNDFFRIEEYKYSQSRANKHFETFLNEKFINHENNQATMKNIHEDFIANNEPIGKIIGNLSFDINTDSLDKKYKDLSTIEKYRFLNLIKRTMK